MQTSELYRQRAAECERMATNKPDEKVQLKKIALTWRYLADAEDEFAEASKAVH
jgi:hypothetical protein